ncbi:MAG: Dabb family protein [Balneolia bacterium]|nr:Dabb family protein [Balneolia bacterium]
MKQSMILHSVYFYFTEDAPDDIFEKQRERIFDLNNKLPVVQLTFAGPPAGIERDVVDNSYGMSLHMLFQDEADLEAYQKHELHQQFISDFKQYWTGIKVFDSSV